jgi:hypothetical protein
MNQSIADKMPASRRGLRLLKWNEIVRAGDFVDSGRQCLEPWVGPGGFRADSFENQIYRRQEPRSNGAKK